MKVSYCTDRINLEETYSGFHLRATWERGRPARTESDRDGRAPRKKGRSHLQIAIRVTRFCADIEADIS